MQDSLVARCDNVLTRVHEGKNRYSYRLSAKGPEGQSLRLVLASNKRSIFDFKLGFCVPHVAEVLNATNIFWREKLDDANIRHDLVAYGPAMNRYLPISLQSHAELMKRAVIVCELKMIPVECVDRRYLTGSGYRTYVENNGNLCGQILRLGLLNGDRLPRRIFTPTTKSEQGHDENMPIQAVAHRYPHLRLRDRTLALGELQDKVLGGRLIRADGKAEGGIDPVSGHFLWGDEIGTPDSSRFWQPEAYAQRRRGAPPRGLDKEPLRDWGRTKGVHLLDPLKAVDRDTVSLHQAPPEVIDASAADYQVAFLLITGTELSDFQRDTMKIPDYMV